MQSPTLPAESALPARRADAQTGVQTDGGLPGYLAGVSPLPALRRYQEMASKAIVQSVLGDEGRTITVVMARQAGKNEVSARAEAELLGSLCKTMRTGVKCAPTFDPQGQISMRRLWSLIVQSGLGEIAKREDGRSIRVGTARQLFLSAEPDASVVGHTADLLLEVDEAQDVDIEKFDHEFRPMAAPSNATIVFYGTPWDDSSLLERAVQHNLERQRRDGIKRHFTADWTQVAEANPAYRRYVEGERDRLGEDHPLFRTQYALKTVAGKGRLFSATQRAQLQGRHARQHNPDPIGETYVAGLDLGGQASIESGQDWASARQHDSTVLTIARLVPATADAIVREPRLEVVEHLRETGTPHDALFARLADLLRNVWNVSRVAVDATGLGETMARLLSSALPDRIGVQAVKFTAESKSRLGYDLLAAVNGGRLKVYAADGSAEYAEFQREIELARIAYRSNQQMNFYVDPADGHDDYLASLALAVQAGRAVDTRPRVARGRVRS